MVNIPSKTAMTCASISWRKRTYRFVPVVLLETPGVSVVLCRIWERLARSHEAYARNIIYPWNSNKYLVCLVWHSERFEGINVLIIGTWWSMLIYGGAVDRISPEAPVPIINVRRRDYRLGGAANVGLNVQALGARPVLCAPGRPGWTRQAVTPPAGWKGMSKEGIVTTNRRPTTLKARVIAAHPASSTHWRRVGSTCHRRRRVHAAGPHR